MNRGTLADVLWIIWIVDEYDVYGIAVWNETKGRYVKEWTNRGRADT